MSVKSKQDLLDRLQNRHACKEATEWVTAQTGDAQQIWNLCQRPDWMLWFAGRQSIDRKILVLIAAACARTSLKFVPPGEDRPRLAIETAEAWARGEITMEQVQNAAYAAARAAYAAAAADAASAAYAAADAARAADAETAEIVRKFLPKVPL